MSLRRSSFKARCRRQLLCLTAALCVVRVPALMAQSEPTSARPLTVELFSSHPVRELTLTQLSKPPAATLHFSMKGPGGATVIGTRGNAMRFEGSYHAHADSSHEEVSASGIWEIQRGKDGLHVLITLPSERYVALALNGEAAPDEPPASLEAMAIVLRTYTMMNAARHAAEGFNLCDSTHCQVLRFGNVRPEIEQAVLATTGETLWYGPKQAKVFFHEDCGGVTEDAASAWPGTQVPYLRSRPDPYCLRRSLARWHAAIPVSRLLAIGRQQGWRLPQQIESIRVVRSTASGRAALLEFSGAGSRALVSASSLRFAVDRTLGWNQIRSDWFDVSLNDGIVRFAGKGYGHGVGLCQAGAYEMAREGHTRGEILRFYFPGTQVRITQEDAGWQSIPGHGWTLVTAGSSRAILPAGDTAWGQAQALFAPRAPLHPEVRIMPTTELFRQATNEPGWILSTARNATVVLQREPLIAKDGGMESVLRHEFLHLLVEQEAAPGTPLWLREGLVEALADETRRPQMDASTSTRATVDAALLHPRDEAASQRAHSSAEALVRPLLDRFGVSTVRRWLREGIPNPVVSSQPRPQQSSAWRASDTPLRGQAQNRPEKR